MVASIFKVEGYAKQQPSLKQAASNREDESDMLLRNVV
jgi:hypothetical protein